MSDEDREVYFFNNQSITIEDFKCAEGWILDIGGGGEGIIGQIKGERVVAIDRLKRELEEAKGDALRVIMDAKDLKFLDNSFQTATAFFSLMYIQSHEDLLKIFSEIYRVLKKGAIFYIWDANLIPPEENQKPVIAFYLEVTLPNGEIVETGYGTRKHLQTQDQIKKVADKVGFKILNSQSKDMLFHLVLEK